MKKINNILSVLLIFLIHLSLNAQQAPTINAKIKGKVTDSQTNEILIGASISIKGTTNGAFTNEDGEFLLLTGQKLPLTLLVSYVGYKNAEIIISDPNVEIKLEESQNELQEIIVSSRRRKESPQEIPLPISVISGANVENTGAFNPNRIKEYIPSVQFYASNGRNTTLNIRGLGSSFGLTNDGIDPGVGFYVDGVYYARPAATAIDFVDIEQIEVLRGPQGTLYGKNTTAGAFNITTRGPSFTPSARFETTYGNLNFIQAKASFTGPLIKKVAGRLSFSGTQRDGTLFNLTTLKPVNTLNNLAFRAQILYTPTENINITVAGDNARQRPDGNATVVAGVVTTKRPAYRQFNQIIADLGYKLPSTNPFDRLTDANSPWKVNNDFGGASINANIKIGNGTLTSTSAWRYWIWDPSNDRDFIGLPVLTKSQGNSKHAQWTQEIRYAGNLNKKLSGVLGLFLIRQDLTSNPVQTEESGAAQWRFSQSSTSPLWKTPGLFDGFGNNTTSRLQSSGAAIFSQLDFAITPKIHLLPGIRYNYDQKEVDYKRVVYGGLQTTDPALLALKNGLYTNQAFNFAVNENNVSGQVTLTYKPGKRWYSFLTYANSYKPVGVNLGGLPTSNGQVLIELARVKPELVSHSEFGIKSEPFANTTINVVLFHTGIKDYQTLVQTPEVGVNRGYLANAEQVRVQGGELDITLKINSSLSFSSSIAYTDGKYISFKNAPVPLEEVGGTSAFKDISGGVLPGISKWAGSVRGDAGFSGKFIQLKGKYFFSTDLFLRSSFSSSPSPSQFLNIDGYHLLNLRMGFNAFNGFTIILWSRNLTNKNYFEQLLPAAGSAGHYAAVLGDQRTWGITLRNTF